MALIDALAGEFGESPSRRGCSAACQERAEIIFWGYAEGDCNIYLCRHHALQLSRKLLEDLCDLEGDRHG